MRGWRCALVSTAGYCPMPEIMNTSKRPVVGGRGNGQSVRRATNQPAKPPDPELSRILGLTVPVSVVVAEQALPIESILQITVGTILEFDVSFGAELSLVVGDRTVGRGNAVKVGENFGLRITNIGTVGQRIGALAGQ